MTSYPQLEIQLSDHSLSVTLLECVLHEARFAFFHAELFFVSEAQINPKKLISLFASVTLKVSEKKWQYVHGILWSVSASEKTVQGMYCYRARLVPTIESLQHQSDCRIFQNQTIPEIAQTIFREHDFKVDIKALTQVYASQEYIVQYQETSWDFLNRLC